MEQPKQEVCSIRIIFPIDSDEQAIDLKKKVAEVLKDVPEVQTQFNISSIATAPH